MTTSPAAAENIIHSFILPQNVTVCAVRSLHIHNTLHSRLLQAWNLASYFFTRLDQRNSKLNFMLVIIYCVMCNIEGNYR